MGFKQESESTGEGKKVSSYKLIVETRDPPVTVLEQYPPEHAAELVISASKEGGWEEMHKLLGLKINPKK
jgi:hypothetical protein